jgi:hypothetical protein
MCGVCMFARACVYVWRVYVLGGCVRERVCVYSVSCGVCEPYKKKGKERKQK